MNCNKCGNQLYNGESFCRNCGTNTNQVINQQPNVKQQTYNQPNGNPNYGNQQPNTNYNVPNNHKNTALIIIVVMVVIIIAAKVLMSIIDNDIYNRIDDKKEIKDNIDSDSNTVIEDINEDNSLTDLEKFFNEKYEYEFVSNVYGEWIFEESNGAYVFNKENSYAVYLDGDRTDNYCEGTMKLRYGVQRTRIESGTKYADYSEDDGTKLYYLLTYPNTCKKDGVITSINKNEGVQAYVINIKDDLMYITRLETFDVFELVRK